MASNRRQRGERLRVRPRGRSTQLAISTAQVARRWTESGIPIRVGKAGSSYTWSSWSTENRSAICLSGVAKGAVRSRLSNWPLV